MRIGFIILGLVFMSPVWGQSAKIDNKVRIENVKDVDNPFAKKLDGSKIQVLDPETIINNLKKLEKSKEDENNEQPALVNADELKDLQSIVNALKQPAQNVEYIAKEKLPLVSQPLSSYQLRGVMVSFADDPSILTEYDTVQPEDLLLSEEVIHVVKGFETLESIAKLYNTSALAIEQANGLLPDDILMQDFPIIVPLSLPTNGTVTVQEYYLQVAALEIKTNNQVVVDKFTARYQDILQGARFKVIPPELNNTPYHKVMVGPFQSLAIAENKCFLLELNGGECLIRQETRNYVDKVKDEIKTKPTYVAIVGMRGTDQDFLVSEGDRLGNQTAVVVSIYEDRLILQDGGVQSVMSMQELTEAPVTNSPVNNAPIGPTVSCAVLINDFAAAPEVQNLCNGDPNRNVACDDLLLATRVGVEACN